MSTILGYEWTDIQRAQQGGRLSHAVDASTNGAPAATDDDMAMLAKHGMDELRSMGLWGIVDRLQRAGVVG